MIRLMGAALVIAGCAAASFGAVCRLDGRVKDLEELTAGLAALQRELCWRLTPLPEAMKEAAEETHGRAAALFDWCARESGRLDGRTFQQVWQDGLERCPLVLNEEDRAALERLGSVLGRYDADGQRQAIDGAVGSLNHRKTQAAEDRNRLGRVYGVLGLTAGLFLVILLI